MENLSHNPLEEFARRLVVEDPDIALRKNRQAVLCGILGAGLFLATATYFKNEGYKQGKKDGEVEIVMKQEFENRYGKLKFPTSDPVIGMYSEMAKAFLYD